MRLLQESNPDDDFKVSTQMPEGKLRIQTRGPGAFSSAWSLARQEHKLGLHAYQACSYKVKRYVAEVTYTMLSKF